MSFVLVYIILVFLNFVHEIGHFCIAKINNLKINQISIGLGLPRFSITKFKTPIHYSLLPLGGFVEINSAVKYEYSLYKKIVFYAGGALANVLVCIALFALLNISVGEITVFSILVSPFLQTVSLLVNIIETYVNIIGEPLLISSYFIKFIESINELSSGLPQFLSLLIILNLNYALVNLLPILPLDGGKIVISVLEKSFPVITKYMYLLNLSGLAIIIFFVFYILVYDVSN